MCDISCCTRIIDFDQLTSFTAKAHLALLEKCLLPWLGRLGRSIVAIQLTSISGHSKHAFQKAGDVFMYRQPMQWSFPNLVI